MPPKVRITKEEILQAAVAFVRENGAQALNARAIATALDCSTQPLFSNFATMEELKTATVAAAYELYLNFINREAESRKYPQYKAFGMAYVRFAMEEKELFKLLFMRDRSGEECSTTPDFERSVEMIAQANAISRKKAELIHLEVWTCVHGMGVMLATSFLSFEWEMISNMLSDVYQGIRARHLSEEDTNERN